MLLQRVDVVVADGQQAAFEAALLEVRQRVFASAGFRGLTVAQDAEHPAAYLVLVRWETPEELLAFVESGRFERCWAPAEPFLAGPLRVGHLHERPSLDATGPGVVTDLSWIADDAP